MTEPQPEPQPIPEKDRLEVISAVNICRLSDSPNETFERLANKLYNATSLFAVYGTLGPGCPNHHRISDIQGTWSEDTVRGSLVQSGWGARMGYPALVWSNDGGQIRVQVLESSCLNEKWEWLDEFEGGEYARLLVPLESGRVANIYAHRDI